MLVVIVVDLNNMVLDSLKHSRWPQGAAYGLAGVVKGLGIPSLKQHGVMASLQAMVEDKVGEDA